MSSSGIRNIFVSKGYSGHSNGSEDAPFESISKAIEVAVPGSRIIIKEGQYSDSLSIQTSGTLSDPIRIEALKDNNVVVTSPWFIYDSSDIIISGIKFKDIESQAISIIGSCERNSINNTSFENCGIDSKTPCTLFIGGSGSNCNVIEKCSFINTKSSNTIGIIVSEGNSDEDALPNSNIIIRENTFRGFETALVIGTREEEDVDGLYGHIIEGNKIIDCKKDGIRIRVGDISIKDNLIKNCGNFGISIKSGSEQTISYNRLEKCKIALDIESNDILIRQNMFLNSLDYHINIENIKSASKGSVAINHNTFSQLTNNMYCIELKEPRPLIARKNLLFNSDKIINENLVDKNFFLEKNYCNIEDTKSEICTYLDFKCLDSDNTNFSTDTQIGATGWQVEGESIPKSEKIDLKSVLKDENAVDALINEIDSKELYSRSFFINQEDNQDDEPPEEEENGEITDYSTWD